MATPSQPQKAPPVYTTKAGEAAIRQLYDRALASLPFPHEERTVKTASFGNTHVTVCGPPSARPLLLWHGTAAPAPYMLAALQPLVERFRIYCPDIPCQAGSRSDDVVLDPATHDHGRWAVEVMEALGMVPLDPAEQQPASGAVPVPLHVGVSLGGCVLLDLAVVKPEAIGGAVLVVPGSLHPGWSSWWRLLQVYLQLLLPMLLYKLIPCAWTARLALTGMCDDPDSDDFTMQNVKLAFRHVCYFPPAPFTMTDAQLARLAAPCLVIAAERDIFGPGKVTAARARSTMPHCEAVVLPGAKHYGSMAPVNEMILDFFSRQGLG